MPTSKSVCLPYQQWFFVLYVAVGLRACLRQPSLKGLHTGRNASTCRLKLLQADKGPLVSFSSLDIQNLRLEHELIAADLLNAQSVQQSITVLVAELFAVVGENHPHPFSYMSEGITDSMLLSWAHTAAHVRAPSSRASWTWPGRLQRVKTTCLSVFLPTTQSSSLRAARNSSESFSNSS